MKIPSWVPVTLLVVLGTAAFVILLARDVGAIHSAARARRAADRAAELRMCVRLMALAHTATDSLAAFQVTTNSRRTCAVVLP